MVVLKQLGAGLELVHRHVTLTVEVLVNSTVTSVGVGGAGVVHYNKQLCGMLHNMYIPLAGRETILGTLVLPLRLPLA